MIKSLKALSKRVESIPHDPMLDFMDQVGKVDNLIDLGFGDPDFAVAKNTKEAFIKSINEDHSHYADGQGTFQLRKAAMDYYDQKYDCKIEDPNEILVTGGAAEAINLALLSIVDKNDGIMIIEPEYSQYSTSVALAGGQKIPVDTISNNFKLTPALVEKNYQTALDKGVKPVAIILNFPNNPTGKSYSLDELKELASIFEKLNLWVLSDEIYAEQSYRQKHHSLYPLIPDQTILITGLSKSHSMTGYRIGFAIAKGEVALAMRKIQDTFLTCLPTPIQDAAAFAVKYDPDAGKRTRKEYFKRIKLVVDKLNQLGFNAEMPDGAFYVWAKVPKRFIGKSFEFCIDLAQKARVQIFPGAIFSSTASDYVRISCAQSEKILSRALVSIENYLKQGS